MVSERLAAALKEAGCVEAWIGAESGSHRILDAMTKDTSLEELVTARKRPGAHGIRVGFFIQLGNLGEQLDDLVATRELGTHRAPADDSGIRSFPRPGPRCADKDKAQLCE